MKKLFLVGLFVKDPNNWEFCGIFDNTEDALARCTQDHNFIAEAFLNYSEPEDRSIFPNLFYPKSQSVPNWFE